MGSGAALNDPEVEALLLLGRLPGVGDRGVLELVQRFGSARAAWIATEVAFARVVGEDAARSRSAPEHGEEVRSAMDRAADLGVRVVAWHDPAYPPVLRQLHDPPPILFLRGRASLLGRTGVAVVGSRRATVSGRRAAEAIGGALAEAGIPVLSGMAMGIDAAAHRGTLDGGGDAVGVLGAGVDVPYPRSNRNLFEALAREHLLVSEFMPGTGAAPHHFPRRNRILAALSSAVVVVEAAGKSGALITVDHALDLGRDVLAVPGPVDRATSVGTNALIRDGAGIVCDPWRIVECLPHEVARSADEAAGDAGSEGGGGGTMDADGRGDEEGLSEDARRIAVLIADGPRSTEELSAELDLGPGRILALLSELELRGLADLLPGGRYIRPARRGFPAGGAGT